MSTSMLLPAAAAFAGAVLCFFFVPRVANKGWGAPPAVAAAEPAKAQEAH
jgi:hypothetical protein